MKKNKMFIITAALLVMAFTFLPVRTGQYMVAASEAYQKVEVSSGKITANEVNLRSGPATTFDILCKLKKDQKVTVLGKLGDWYAVYVSGTGNVGAVSSHYIKLDEQKTKSATKQAASTSPKGSGTSTVPKTDNAASKSSVSSGNAVTKTAESKATVKPAAVQQLKDISADEQSLFDLVNKARKEKGLKALEFDASLVKIARLKAKDMRDNNYFSHTSKYYGTPFDMMKKYGVKFSTAGENIAGNQSVEKVVKAWLKESGNNIYNDKFNSTGIGIVESPTYGKLFVQLFIKK